MKFTFELVEHKHQRYPTVGNYFFDKDVLRFQVSEMQNRRYEWLVFLHEFVEFHLCHFAGIAMEDIDNFDEAYEHARSLGRPTAPCGCVLKEEPGSDKHAPYVRQHRLADIVERTAAWALGVDWADYENTIERL